MPEGSRVSAAGVRDRQPYGKASQDLVTVGLEQPLPQEGWSPPSGHKDTDSQSARNRAGAECCNAIFLMTTLFVCLAAKK